MTILRRSCNGGFSYEVAGSPVKKIFSAMYLLEAGLVFLLSLTGILFVAGQIVILIFRDYLHLLVLGGLLRLQVASLV